MDSERAQHPAWTFLALFTSFGTLVCCALPSLLVFLGFGATVASSLTSLPFLVTLSQHKAWAFVASGFFVGFNLVYVYRLAPRLRAAGDVCVVDQACETASRLSRVVLWVSVLIYLAGFFVAYLLAPLIARSDPTLL